MSNTKNFFESNFQILIDKVIGISQSFTILGQGGVLEDGDK